MLTEQPIVQSRLIKRMILGAVIGLALIVVFLSQKIQVNPDWGKYWMVKPLLMMPFAGAMGGLCYYFIDYFFQLRGWSKFMAILLSLIVFIVGLFFGFVLGLNGTLWN